MTWSSVSGLRISPRGGELKKGSIRVSRLTFNSMKSLAVRDLRTESRKLVRLDLAASPKLPDRLTTALGSAP